MHNAKHKNVNKKQVCENYVITTDGTFAARLLELRMLLIQSNTIDISDHPAADHISEEIDVVVRINWTGCTKTFADHQKIRLTVLLIDDRLAVTCRRG